MIEVLEVRDAAEKDSGCGDLKEQEQPEWAERFLHVFLAGH